MCLSSFHAILYERKYAIGLTTKSIALVIELRRVDYIVWLDQI